MTGKDGKDMARIRARMPGRILCVCVKAGDAFAPKQTLAVLESMKMEQPVFSREGGVIKEIFVREGEFVKTGQILMGVSETDSPVIIGKEDGKLLTDAAQASDVALSSDAALACGREVSG